MNENERLDGIKAFWNENSDSEWYRSLRTEEKIHALQERPERAFHPAVYALIRKIFPDLTKAKVLLPLLGAQVTSADISERQLENAAEIAARLRLNIEFVCDDTMQLSHISNQAYDLVYTSNGTLSWMNDLDSMNRNICRVLKKGGYFAMCDMHPFNRPFSGEAWQAPHIIKSYQDVLPDLHWRIQDILNSQIRAGLTLCEMAELPATDASFWFTFAELQQKSREELEGINDWKKNPMAALPAWLALVSQKAE